MPEPKAPRRGLPPERRMRHDRHFVDELTRTSGETIGRMISVASIISNQDQPRANLGNLTELVASVSRHGVLEPLLVRRAAGGTGYELISGERRLHAAIEAGLTEVPCVELTVADQQALEIALVENLQRKDLSAFEEAEGYRTLIDKYGYTHERVAEAVGRSRVTVTESLRVLAIPGQLREECLHADITAKGILLEIARLPSAAAMKTLIAEIANHRLDREAVRARRQELESSDVANDAPLTPADSRHSRPFVVRFRHPDRLFSVALSFRTENQPETREIITALEEMIRDLRSDLEGE